MYKVDRFNVIKGLFSVFGKRVGSKFLNLEYKDETLLVMVSRKMFILIFLSSCFGLDALG